MSNSGMHITITFGPLLETLPPIIDTTDYHFLLLTFANHITLKKTHITWWTIVYSRLEGTIIRVII